MIAAALERKTWVHTAGSSLYPNMYILLVAPPGVGKTVLTSLIQTFWKELGDHHIAPSSVSRASLTDALKDAERKVINPEAMNPVTTFNSLYIAANELQVFLPSYDGEFMAFLTDLYDCKTFDEKKRGAKLEIKIANPQLNFLSATTPSSLSDMLPPGAWDQGFMSRMILVFNGNVIRKSLFSETGMDDKLFADLVHDLLMIGDLKGKMSFTPEAAHAIDKWHMAGGPPAPDNPRLVNYNTRRTAHLLKLCQVASAITRDDLVIGLEEYAQALEWLLEAEAGMPEIFAAMKPGGDGKIMEDAHYFAMKVFTQEKQDVSEARMIEFLQSRAPAYAVERILAVMEKGGLLKKTMTGYKPRMQNLK